MSGAPKTLAAARALRQPAPGEQLYLGALPIDGDAICAFVDADGRAKRVTCVRTAPDGPDEWVKQPL